MAKPNNYIKPDLKLARKRLNPLTEKILYSLPDKFKNIGNSKTYHILTYGCQGNEADSEVIAGILAELGYTYKEDFMNADLVLLNTCAIRENAENRIWGVLGNLKAAKRANPFMTIGICGCMPQEENVIDKLLEKYREVNLVFGTHNIYKLPEYLAEIEKHSDKVVEVFSTEGAIIEQMPKIRENRHKAWVNIMYGCDEFCTYCIVPYTRGKERSRNKEDIISEVNTLVSDGYQEIILLGQNVNAYGKDLKSDYTFGDLLKELASTGIKRIRYTTSHPKDLDDKTIEAMASSEVIMPHLHLPVQSGSDVILKKMNRKYSSFDYLNLVGKLRYRIPGISLTTDIIVGFPNETEEDFIKTLELVEKVNFEGAYTFIFSAKEGTPAYTYDDEVTIDEKHNRLKRLNELINIGYLRGHQRFLGETVEVLVDGLSKNNTSMLAGYTPHNKLVNFPGDSSLIGRIVRVKIKEAKTWFLLGEIDE